MDPFCGSGTFPIEAAMIAAGIAPGMNRSFLAEDWKDLIPRKYWYYAMDEARERVSTDIETDIQGYDLDGEIVKAARENAKLAGVEQLIHFQQRPVSAVKPSQKIRFCHHQSARMESVWKTRQPCRHCIQEIGEASSRLDSWSDVCDYRL